MSKLKLIVTEDGWATPDLRFRVVKDGFKSIRASRRTALIQFWRVTDTKSLDEHGRPRSVKVRGLPAARELIARAR